MAATTAARRLTEKHRLAQNRIAAQTVARMHLVWPLLDPEAVDASFERWFTAADPIIQTQSSKSAELAANYLRTFKALELGGIEPASIVIATAPSEAVATSLWVEGPVSIKRAMTAGMPVAKASELAETRSASAAMRHALNGGRETTTRSTNADAQALGWARVTAGRKVCSFCAMLASRGPVYQDDTARFQAHDHCTCSVEPVYRDDAAWPTGSDRWRDLWAQARDAEGDTEANFRQLVAAA